MKFNKLLLRLMVLLCGAVICSGSTGSSKGIALDELKKGFVNPPDSVRPGVYWYFMDGNRTYDGMTADLEAMKRAGIGSVIFLEVDVGVPRGPVDFLSEEWQDMFVYAVREAERLGIEVILGIGPGWTGSGGPWVAGEQSMKHLVASRVQVSGGGRQQLTLPVPPPKPPYFGEGTFTPELKVNWQDYYEDVAVLAFPTPQQPTEIPLIDEKALYYRHPYTSMPGVKPYFVQDELFGEPDTAAAIDPATLVDLTGSLRPDGTLQWDVPPGNWTVMRFVSRNNGAGTRPAPLPGVGFESDKFDSLALKYHLDTYVGKLLDRGAPIAKRRGDGGLTRLHMDSWEMGAQNWTAAFREEFQQRRGYDPQPFYPVYAGNIVQSREISERFLWDLRLTAQELVLEHHARYVKAYGQRRGLKMSIEPYDMNPLSDMELGSVADVPMCEFWSQHYGFNGVFSCIEASSVAHIEGRPVVAAEAFTSQHDEAWKQYPGAMKNQGDWAFAAGINQFMFHTFQHQSLADSLRPGMTMGPYGVHWDRNQTWWHLSDAYHRYLARCSYLLQQGRTVADILYLTAEGAPHVFTPPSSALDGDPFLADRKGYNFDGCTPSQLLKARVDQREIVFPSGARYQVLVLPLTKTMTPALLKAITGLVEAGASVVGIPPLRSPGLANYPQCDMEVRSLSKALWGDTLIPEAATLRKVGKGVLLWGGEASKPTENSLYPDYGVVETFLTGAGLVADFTVDKPIRYTHRTSDDWDLYFVSNRTADVHEALCHFRIQGGQPQLWDPVTGTTRELTAYEENGTQVAIPIRFEPHQSFFVVFPRKRTTSFFAKANGENIVVPKPVVEIKGPWEVLFDPAWGGPEQITFDKLTDWTERPEEGIRHYSGSARYVKTFAFNGEREKGRRLYIDLGMVNHMASVKLNGSDLGVLWTAPWRVDVTDHIKKGTNKLEIEVVNLWVNRLIGDQYHPDDGVKDGKWPDWLKSNGQRNSKRYTFTTFNPYTTDSPLLPSGLVGPVYVTTE